MFLRRNDKKKKNENEYTLNDILRVKLCIRGLLFFLASRKKARERSTCRKTQKNDWTLFFMAVFAVRNSYPKLERWKKKVKRNYLNKAVMTTVDTFDLRWLW